MQSVQHNDLMDTIFMVISLCILLLIVHDIIKTRRKQKEMVKKWEDRK